MVRVGLCVVWCVIFFAFYVLPGFQEFRLVKREISQMEDVMRVKKDKRVEEYFMEYDGEFWDVIPVDSSYQVKLSLYDEIQSIKSIERILKDMTVRLVSFDMFYDQSLSYIVLFFEKRP